MQKDLQDNIITCANPPVDHLEGCGYLFGYPIAHSLSPIFHHTIFDSLALNWDYLPLPSTDLRQFIRLLKEPRCYGSGVTMPNKVAIIPYLDEMTPEAEAVGACNTIFKRQSKLIGTNTDIVGIRESFLKNVPVDTWSNRPAMVIGGGGAARSAVYALVEYMKCKDVYLVNRDHREVEAVISWCVAHGYGQGLHHVATVAQAEQSKAVGAIVACIPDFPPKTSSELEARRIIECFLAKSHKGAMLEMCYHPNPWTEIGNLAEHHGWEVILGTEAMIYQGFEQARHWTGRALQQLPVQEVKHVIARELSRPRL